MVSNNERLLTKQQQYLTNCNSGNGAKPSHQKLRLKATQEKQNTPLTKSITE
ncbi:12816_t:CDS:1, partial [Gigaspora margarita]